MNASAESARRAPALTPAADQDQAPTHTHSKTKRRAARLRPVILTVVGAAVLAWGAHFAVHAYRYEETDDAFVAGHLHTVSSQIDGQVLQVLVDDNQVVHAGDVLLRLDPLQFQIAVEKAKAALAQTQAEERQLGAAAAQSDAALLEARARVKQAEAQRVQTKAQLDLANLTLARNEQLITENSAARSELDQARSAAEAAAAAHDAAGANLGAAQAAVASAEAAQKSVHAQIEAAHAAVAASQAALHDAERQLGYTTITAPTDGRIGNRHLEAGNRVLAGQALLALAEPQPWVIANFKETQLAHMVPGQEVELTVDALPGQTLGGRIESLSPASGAQFALLPPDNATGNFNKVVQRIPVKILFDADTAKQLGDRLRLGLSVVVNVRVR